MKKIILFLLFVLIFSKNAFASLKLNEIYPAPPSGEDEWVELYNSSSSSADLSEYVFDDDFDFNSDSGSGTKISLFGILSKQSTCYWKLSNYLNNTGDKPTLFKADGSLVDSYTYATTQTGKSYSRIPDSGEWQTNVDPTKSSVDCSTLVPMPSPSVTPLPTLNPIPSMPTIAPTEGTGNPTPTSPAIVLTEAGTPTPQSYDNIYISEAMVNPATGEKEWVEIYNNNDFPVSLNNWYIDDLENGGSSPKIFSLEINAKSYGIFDLTSSIFNNDGDSVRLLDFNKNLKDDFEYGKTEQGKTLGRTSFDSDDFCLQESSKNSANNPCINPTPTIISSVLTEQINLSQTINNPPSKIPISKDVSTLPAGRQVHRSINYPTGVIQKNYDNGDVLGITSATTNNNLLLIRCLTFVSFSYSLLVIVSVLVKSKVLKKYVLAN